MLKHDKHLMNKRETNILSVISFAIIDLYLQCMNIRTKYCP